MNTPLSSRSSNVSAMTNASVCVPVPMSGAWVRMTCVSPSYSMSNVTPVLPSASGSVFGPVKSPATRPELLNWKKLLLTVIALPSASKLIWLPSR
jgi:hypothetical protein